MIALPVPRCVVFYNGTEEEPDEQKLRLSSAFPQDKREMADVELTVHMLNVNSGHNETLMEACRPMYEYAWTVEHIRIYSQETDVEMAVNRTLEEMPEDFRIRSFLLENKEEVQMSVLTEYDAEEELRLIAKDSWEEGMEKGIEKGIEKGQDMLIDVIGRLRGGESSESILSSGVDPHTVDLALKVV